MNKTKLLGWAVVLLVVLNLTTIATIIYHNVAESKISESVIFEPNTAPLSGRCFKETLGFDTTQMELFRSSNHTFRRKANSLVREINTVKEEMFDELQQAQPNIEKLNQMSARIGELHAELKKETVRFYISLKEICTDEQEKKLKTLFMPLFENTSRVGGQGNGYRHRNINR